MIDRLDDILKDYGGIGTIGRKDQFSNRFLSEELKQQRTIATIFPVIFFGVAAFLLNVVISRLIRLQREEVATLKAFGYSDIAIGIHYIKLVLLIVSLGVIIGIGAGIWMGKGMSNIYMVMYSLPYMIYVLKPQVIIAAALISMAVAVMGTLYAVYSAARLPPAQAMQPELPAKYHTTLAERLGLQRWLSQPTRMILRHIERRPLKSLMTTLGIAMACGIMMVSGFQEGAINYMVEIQYGMSQREDMIAIYTEPASKRSLYSLQSLQGVEHAEGFRLVPANFKFEHRFYRTALHGIEPKAASTGCSIPISTSSTCQKTASSSPITWPSCCTSKPVTCSPSKCWKGSVSPCRCRSPVPPNSTWALTATCASSRLMPC